MEDYKEKYEKSVEKLKKFFTNDDDRILYKRDIESVFPELKESEDDRIRKEIIDYLDREITLSCFGGDIATFKKWIAWLEKQGEQKPTDIAKPKFKVGDWIGWNHELIIGIIISFDGEYYYYISPDGDEQPLHISNVSSYHLWTIQDAKDGDVLAASDGSTFIFKEVMDCGCKHYIALEKDNETINVNDNLKHFWESVRGVNPSTREQRDLLFQKMKEAGYEWDAEKKELRKISQEYPLTSDECIKPIWSEEDEKILQTLINDTEKTLFAIKQEERPDIMSGLSEIYIERLRWLKSLKERIGE